MQSNTDLTELNFEPTQQFSSENFVNDAYKIVKRDKGKQKDGREEIVIETSIKGLVYSCEVLKENIMIDGEEVNCSHLQSEENRDSLFRDKYLEAHNYLKERYLENRTVDPSEDFKSKENFSFSTKYKEENGEVEIEPLTNKEEVNHNNLQIKEDQDVEEDSQLEKESMEEENFDKDIQLEEFQNDNNKYCKVTSYQSKDVVKTVIEVSGTGFEEIQITVNNGKKEDNDKKYYNIKIK